MSAKGKTSSAQHIPELDGIRGVAIGVVILYHFGQSERTDLLSSLLNFGWSGVDLFFALSGFLITGILLETKASLNYFRIFYLRRVLRILPLYTLILVMFFHLAVPLAHYLHRWLAMPVNTEPWYWFYLANWVIGHHRSISVLVPYWSLSVEEQFYAVWPIVVLLSSEKVLTYISGAVIAAAIALRCLYSPDPGGVLVYVWTPFRMDSLALGALAAILYRNRSWLASLDRWLVPVGAAAAAAVAGFCVAAGSTSGDTVLMQRFGFTLIGVACTCVVLRCASRSGSGDLLSRLMGSKPLRRLGTVSYGLYLLHYAFYMALGPAMASLERRIPLPPAIHTLLMISIGGSLSYLAAEASWRLLEQRILSLKRNWPYRYRQPAVAAGGIDGEPLLNSLSGPAVPPSR
jgi:peptidoglycan/LPS O-acetylase OafA/YrhL